VIRTHLQCRDILGPIPPISDTVQVAGGMGCGASLLARRPTRTITSDPVPATREVSPRWHMCHRGAIRNENMPSEMRPYSRR